MANRNTKPLKQDKHKHKDKHTQQTEQKQLHTNMTNKKRQASERKETHGVVLVIHPYSIVIK
jgi:hypothetical protein